MKRLLCAVLLLSGFCHAQAVGGNSTKGNITTANASCLATNCVYLQQSGDAGTVVITITGTFSGTVQFEQTSDILAPDKTVNSLTWTASGCMPQPNTGSGTPVTSATAVGQWVCSASGMTFLRVRGSSYSSGTVTVGINSSPASAKSQFGGGGSSITGLTANFVPIATGTPNTPFTNSNFSQLASGDLYIHNAGVTFDAGDLSIIGLDGNGDLLLDPINQSTNWVQPNSPNLYMPQGTCTNAAGFDGLCSTSTGFKYSIGTTGDLFIPQFNAALGTSAQIPIMNAGATSAVWQSITGCTLTNAGALSCAGLSGGTTGFILKYSSATAATPSLVDEAITTANTLTVADTAGIAVVQNSGLGGNVSLVEGTATGSASGRDAIYADSTRHILFQNLNANGYVSIPFTLCSNVTSVTVSANVSTDQLLMACTIPAGTMNIASARMRIWGSALYTTPAANLSTVNVKVKLCSVSGCGSGTVLTLASFLSSANPGTVTNNSINWLMDSATVTAGASSTLLSHGNMTIDLGASPGLADSTFSDSNTAVSSTIDDTAQMFIQITVAASSASASNSFKEDFLGVEILY